MAATRHQMRHRGWPRGWRGGVVLAGALWLGACGGSAGVDVVGRSQVTDAPVVTTPEVTTPESTDPASTDVQETDPPVTEPDATVPDTEPTTTLPGVGDLLPTGDEKTSVFSDQSDFDGELWQGYIGGLIETDRDEYNEDDGRCVLAFGTLELTDLAEGVVASGYGVPTINLIADGQLVEQTSLECNTDAIQAAGYDRSYNAYTTVGTTYPFFAEYFIEGGDDSTSFDALVIGDPSGGDAIGFEPTEVVSVPTPPVGQVGEFDEVLTPTGDPTVATFSVSSPYSDRTWSGVVQGMVETGPSEYTEETGRCVTVFATMTPTATDGKTDAIDAAVTGGGEMPEIRIIAAGKLIEATTFDCDTAPIEAAGYASLYDTSVTLGTSVAVYRQFLIEGDPATVATDTPIAAIVVGDARSNSAAFFEPTPAPAIVAPLPPTIGKFDREVVPVGDPTKSVFTYTDPYGGTSWSGVVLGLVDAPIEEFSGVTGRCLVLVGTFTPTKNDDGTVTETYDVPTMGLIAGGRLSEATTYDCDTSAAEAAGFLPAGDAQLTVGTEYRFAVAFRVQDPAAALEAIVIGDARLDGARYFAPAVLPALPE